jgi:hypothetical protein
MDFQERDKTAKIARFTPEQVRSYEESLKFYRDIQNTLETARQGCRAVKDGQGLAGTRDVDN